MVLCVADAKLILISNSGLMLGSCSEVSVS